jgi:hypothetical protein
MIRSAVVTLAALGALLAGLRDAAADRPASTGWYAEGGLGATSFVGKVYHDANPGPSLELHVGRDLF